MRSLAMINLAGALIVFVLAMTRLLPPWSQARYRPELPNESWSTLTLADPALGVNLGVALPVRTGKRVALVVNDCGECNASKVQSFSQAILPSDVFRIVLVANDMPIAEAEKRFGHYPNITFADLAPADKKRWNVSFLPRVYAFDEKGALRFLQPPSDSYGQAIYAAGKRLN